MAANTQLFEIDPGYNLAGDSDIPLTLLPVSATLPSSGSVNTKYLPPPGQQKFCPSCCSWASTYGLCSFFAASKGDYSPTEVSQQASPAFIYIQVMLGRSEPTDTCKGSSFGDYFAILKNGGTPTLETSPYFDGTLPNKGVCDYLWKQYANASPVLDTSFQISGSTAISTKDTDQVKQAIINGTPIGYGTELYTDFTSYNNSSPVPYKGNGQIAINPSTNKPVGHCMVIIAYNDNIDNSGTGAFLIQNSFGSDWGYNGQVWMVYDTFTKLAQGTGFFVQ